MKKGNVLIYKMSSHGYMVIFNKDLKNVLIKDGDSTIDLNDPDLKTVAVSLGISIEDIVEALNKDFSGSTSIENTALDRQDNK